MRMPIVWLVLLLITLGCGRSEKVSEPVSYWHGVERKIRYTPDDEDFVIINGDRRFNRSLYGGNTAFRVEAGDLPEFAIYLPGMGGNLQFQLSNGTQYLPIIHAEWIEARYRAGSMHYIIKDPILGEGELQVAVIPTFQKEGMVLKAQLKNTPEDTRIRWIYGGVSGKKFKRDGDIGADPESVFYLTPDKCLTNEIRIQGNGSAVTFYGDGIIMSDGDRYDNEQSTNSSAELVESKKSITSIFPYQAALKIGDAEFIQSGERLWTESEANAPILVGELSVSDEFYIGLFPNEKTEIDYADLASIYENAESDRLQIASRINLKTPDNYLNNLGGALAIAADAVWEDPSFLHGAVAWRMPLVGWRGAYIGDWLGWHDRARTHFSAYAASQYKSPKTADAAPDPKRNLARQIEKQGYSIFTEGYLSRRPGKENSPHHYDMNLVYIDQLIRHFDWNGDLDYLREMWPVIMRHMDWEKRNFDPDDDGLYNAYACIWASDALEYNGGGVAHSSAYNYYSNKRVAELADMIDEDPSRFTAEAEKIKNALEKELWLPEKGTYAEYRDDLGLGRKHEQPGLWTIYHLIDSEVPDAFQMHQMINYIANKIPHIPVRAEGLSDEGYYTLSTTNWLPYTWSVNNIALAEVQHTALAMWQVGASEEAFKLWKSSLMESMYLGACPGNFQQLSYYDAMRGELYRDFSDPVAMTARSLVEGLFGFKPKLLEDKVIIEPGFPKDWDFAELTTPDFTIDFRREEQKDRYHISHNLGASQLELKIPAIFEKLLEVKVNGANTNWSVDSAVGNPVIIVSFPFDGEADIVFEWSGAQLEDLSEQVELVASTDLELGFGAAISQELYDPQKLLDEGKRVKEGKGILFASLKQGDFSWWEPIEIEVIPAIDCELIKDSIQTVYGLSVTSRSGSQIDKIKVNGETIELGANLDFIPVRIELLQCGTNRINIELSDGSKFEQSIINWDISNSREPYLVELKSNFNDQVTNIFRNEYVTPRSPYPTLQLPKQGLGDWCSYAAYLDIDDAGIRNLAGSDQKISVGRSVSFSIPKDTVNNIIFTSLWDNYPDSVSVPLEGKSNHAYFLMAGSTNPMQSRFENGQIKINYQDGSSDLLSLRNPETWYPIEQDYYEDGYAFDNGAPKPIRVHLKSGWIGTEFSNYVSIDHFTNYAIDGGAATVLDLPLNPEKELHSLVLKTTANDVVVGLMAVSLLR